METKLQASLSSCAGLMILADSQSKLTDALRSFQAGAFAFGVTSSRKRVGPMVWNET
jgi:hypothetical protein